MEELGIRGVRIELCGTLSIGVIIRHILRVRSIFKYNRGQT